MTPDPDDLYAVLIKWASKRRWRPYTQLSHDYQARTGDWFEPHGSWDHPLGDLNRRLAPTGAPPLSALVVVQGTDRPGRGFWGSAPNVPISSNELEREAAWGRIVEEVFAYPWPHNLP